jgi:hypothetical protein
MVLHKDFFVLSLTPSQPGTQSHKVQVHMMRQDGLQRLRIRLYCCMCSVCCAGAQYSVRQIGGDVEAGVNLSCPPCIGPSRDQFP